MARRIEVEFGMIMGGDMECWLGEWVSAGGAVSGTFIQNRKKKNISPSSWLAERSDILLVCPDKHASH